MHLGSVIRTNDAVCRYCGAAGSGNFSRTYSLRTYSPKHYPLPDNSPSILCVVVHFPLPPPPPQPICNVKRSAVSIYRIDSGRSARVRSTFSKTIPHLVGRLGSGLRVLGRLRSAGWCHFSHFRFNRRGKEIVRAGNVRG